MPRLIYKVVTTELLFTDAKWQYPESMKPLPEEDLSHILDHTRHFWEKMRGRRIFISGATGFFGVWFLESFEFCNQRLGLGASMIALSRDPKAFRAKMPHLANSSSIHFVEGDVREFDFPSGSFDAVIHGAVSTSLDAANKPSDLMSILLRGTERMIEFARQKGANKFLFISSGAVYGQQPDLLSHVPEQYRGGPDWLDPKSVYGEGKRIAEQMCSIFAQETGVHVGLARCFTLIGPHLPLDQHFAVGNFIRDALAGKNILVNGDGSPVRSYLYAADLMIWLWTLLLRAEELPSNPLALNIGSDQEIRISDLAREVARVLDSTIEVEVASKMPLAERQPRYVPDIRKAQEVLGLTPLIGLPEAIRRTGEWYR